MNMPASIRRIYLIGLMGAGKTTVGKILAAVLEWQFVDMDHEIEILANLDIPEIFKTHGEEGFRNRETQILKNTINLDGAIISCGGGVVTQADNIEILSSQTTAWLDLSPAEASARLEHSKNRPLLDRSEDTLNQLNEILIERRDAYAKAATIRISSGGQSPEVIASGILKELETINV